MKKTTFLSIKAKTCFQVSMHIRVFLVANPFRLRLRRTRGIRWYKTWELHQTKCHDTLWWWNTLNRRPWLYTLDFYTKVQVWGMMSHQKPSWLKRKKWCSPALLKKERIKKELWKKRKLKKKQREENNIKRERNDIYRKKQKRKKRRERILLFHIFVTTKAHGLYTLVVYAV